MSVHCTFPGEHSAEGSGNQDSDVLYLKILDTELVVLNSTEAIAELIEKRSNIYSDRVSLLTTTIRRSPLTGIWEISQ